MSKIIVTDPIVQMTRQIPPAGAPQSGSAPGTSSASAGAPPAPLVFDVLEEVRAGLLGHYDPDRHPSPWRRVFQRDGVLHTSAYANSCGNIAALPLDGDIRHDFVIEVRSVLRPQAGELALLRALCEHVLAMADDGYLEGHPEWMEIVADARRANGAVR